MIGLVAIGAVVVAGGACSDPYGYNGGGSCTPTATRVCTVGLTAFTPVTLTVPESTTVMWLNGGAVAHTVTSDPGSSEPFDLTLGVASGAVPHRFNTAGTYTYHCQFHGLPGTGMHGTIKVNALEAP
jgi:plastocyanin